MHIHVHDNSYLSELLLLLLHQQGMFQLSRVVHVGHLEVTFEYLFTPVLMFRQSCILVFNLRLVKKNVAAAECACLVVSVI